jgi:TRAP-type C4-dicarboxylate transport system permease small subunit
MSDIRFVNEENMTLPTNSVSFQAENARSWLVRFWELPGKWVGIAFPFGFVLWILFYFDHNVSVCSPSSKRLKEG